MCVLVKNIYSIYLAVLGFSCGMQNLSAAAGELLVAGCGI